MFYLCYRKKLNGFLSTCDGHETMTAAEACRDKLKAGTSRWGLEDNWEVLLVESLGGNAPALSQC